jgi:hypothetical protein
LAALYVDALDALEHEAAHRNYGLDREEALGLIESVVERHHSDVDQSMNNEIDWPETSNGKARLVLEALRNAGWLQEEQHSDWRRLVFFDSDGIILIQALRKIAFPTAVVFSDKLVNVCATLANRQSLAEQPWAAVEACVANLEAGIAELRGMQKSIERHTKEQLAASTLKENLAVLFDRFAEHIGRKCYAQFVNARLPSKLAAARRNLEELECDFDLLAKMQAEVIQRMPSLSSEGAMSRVRLRLNEFGELLDHIEPLADAIDKRTADFARRSQARFRYLQETTSENRGKVQAFFETLNRCYAGFRVAQLDMMNLQFPEILLHEAKIPWGLDSLYTPRLRRSSIDVEPLEESDAHQQDRTLAQLEANIRDSLTVGRANRFVARLPLKRGSSLSSQHLLRDHVHNDEDIGDIIACLLHAKSLDADYEIRVPRSDADDDIADFDYKLRYQVERFTLLKR